MRRMFVSRSSFEKPSPLLRWVRTSSPSSSSTRRPCAAIRSRTACASVDLPTPDRPVNHSVNPPSPDISTHIPNRPSNLPRPERVHWSQAPTVADDALESAAIEVLTLHDAATAARPALVWRSLVLRLVLAAV